MTKAFRLIASTGIHKGDRDYQQDQVALLSHPRYNGCVLAVVADAESSSELLAEQGIYSKKIGELTKGRDKILINGEERQNLNRPEADSLLTILA